MSKFSTTFSPVPRLVSVQVRPRVMVGPSTPRVAWNSTSVLDGGGGAGLLTSSRARDSWSALSAVRNLPPVLSARHCSWSSAVLSETSKPTTWAVKSTPSFSSRLLSWHGSRWQVSRPSETSTTVALSSVYFSASAALSTAADNGVLPLGEKSGDRPVDGLAIARGRLHQHLDVRAIALVPMAIGHQADPLRRRQRVHQLADHLLGDRDLRLTVHPAPHRARRIEDEDGPAYLLGLRRPGQGRA